MRIIQVDECATRLADGMKRCTAGQRKRHAKIKYPAVRAIDCPVSTPSEPQESQHRDAVDKTQNHDLKKGPKWREEPASTACPGASVES
jgi:hypothetical protein